MDDRTPLLDEADEAAFTQFPASGHRGDTLGLGPYGRARREAQRFLSSRAKHWLILALVVLDVAGILADIFIGLVTCELGIRGHAWVGPTRSFLTHMSLVLSCLFLAELIVALWAEGPRRYLSSWLICFDAFVIIASFLIDLLEHSVAEEIASLIVVLRLWRFIKLANEFTVEASEHMEEAQKRIEELEQENASLKEELQRYKQQGEEGSLS